VQGADKRCQAAFQAVVGASRCWTGNPSHSLLSSHVSRGDGEAVPNLEVLCPITYEEPATSNLLAENLDQHDAITFTRLMVTPAIQTWSRRGNASVGWTEPLIAAFASDALGGGCELAMTRDSIVGAETPASVSPRSILSDAVCWRYPRLTRTIGKSAAMHAVLCGVQHTPVLDKETTCRRCLRRNASYKCSSSTRSR
jgi:hypothetical protein